MQRVRLQKSANRRSNRGCLIVVPSRPSKRGQRAVAPRAAEVLEAVSSVGRVTALKHELLNRVAGLDRGQIATFDDKSEIALLAERLSGAMQNPVDPAKLAGRWQLIYCSAEAFRSSPFFWAFQEGLVGDRTIAGQIFSFTDNIPGAYIGAAFQTFDLAAGSLVSDVDLYVFPFIRGTVVTTSAVEFMAPNTLAVTVQNTRVRDSNAFQFAEAVVVPVQDIFERLRGAGATRVTAEVTYLDDSLRVTMTKPDNQLFIYRRA